MQRKHTSNRKANKTKHAFKTKSNDVNAESAIMNRLYATELRHLL